MLIMHVRAAIKPESRQAFLDMARDVVENTRSEPGCLSYACCEDIAEPNAFIFYEEWRAKEDIEAHFAQPYTQALLAAAGQWVTVPPAMTLHEVATSTPMPA